MANYHPDVIELVFNNKTGFFDTTKKETQYINDKPIVKSGKVAKGFAGIYGVYAGVDEYGVLHITNDTNEYKKHNYITDSIPDDHKDIDDQEEKDIANYIANYKKAIEDSSVNIENYSDNSNIPIYIDETLNHSSVDSTSLAFEKDNRYSSDDKSRYVVSSKTPYIPSVFNGYDYVTSSTWENGLFLYYSHIYKNGENFESFTNWDTIVDDLENLGFKVNYTPIPSYMENRSNDYKHNWAYDIVSKRVKELEDDIMSDLPKVINKIKTDCCILACCEPDKYILI